MADQSVSKTRKPHKDASPKIDAPRGRRRAANPYMGSGRRRRHPGFSAPAFLGSSAEIVGRDFFTRWQIKRVSQPIDERRRLRLASNCSSALRNAIGRFLAPDWGCGRRRLIRLSRRRRHCPREAIYIADDRDIKKCSPTFLMACRPDDRNSPRVVRLRSPLGAARLRLHGVSSYGRSRRRKTLRPQRFSPWRCAPIPRDPKSPRSSGPPRCFGLAPFVRFGSGAAYCGHHGQPSQPGQSPQRWRAR